ncbi:MAG: 4,5-DOPA dioxygenase extradiol [Marivirga sp.]|nr:4,5-DOPA dioxygenase extradiol [Marivirga sp.]
MNSLKDLKKYSDTLKDDGKKMPVLFVGHGSPMNGIEDNAFSQRWRQMGRDIPTPTAVLCVSAHWFTRGTLITAMDHPKTIHDFGGFPQALFAVQYPAPGSPQIAKQAIELVQKTKVIPDHDWGLDHGTWSIVRHMYPDATIPVLQLSIDYTQNAQYHYELAHELSQLRKKGVLIIGSGNMVHNLRILNWNQPESGFDWAVEMNDTFKKLIAKSDHESLIHYERLGQAAKLSIPTPEHYLPLMYTLGLQDKSDAVSIFNDKTLMGSISMTSVLLQ